MYGASSSHHSTNWIPIGNCYQVAKAGTMDALAEGQLRSSLLELDAHGSLAPRVEPTVPLDLLQ